MEIPAVSARLTGFGSKSMGLVELLHAGVWRRVCDTKWGMNEGYVVCRQLGYPNVITVTVNVSSRAHSVETTSFKLENVTCTGDESDISECYKGSKLTVNCVDGLEAAVVCDTSKCLKDEDGREKYSPSWCKCVYWMLAV